MNICGVSSATVSDTLKMASGYSTLTTAEKKTLFNTIITYNGYSNIAAYLDSMASEVNFFIELVKNVYVVTSMETIYDSTVISYNCVMEIIAQNRKNIPVYRLC